MNLKLIFLGISIMFFLRYINDDNNYVINKKSSI